MALRIGFDLDGVLADLDRAILDIAVGLFGPDQVQTSDAGARPRLTGGQSILTWTSALDTADFWETLAETEPGIVARLERDARACGWEVVFVTQRPATAGDPVEDQTRRWLASHGYPDARVVMADPARGATVGHLGLDVALDDRPENCASIVAQSRAHAILVWRDGWGPIDEGVLAPGISVVATVGEALDRLCSGATPKLDSTRP
jgi:hypothetical protein